MKTTRDFLTVVTMIAAIGLAAGVQAGTVSTSTTAPTVDGSDIAMLDMTGAAGVGKFWAGEGFAAGQTFTTANDAVGYRLNAVTIRYAGGGQPTKTYGVRVTSLSGTTITELSDELFVHSAVANANDYLTFAFNSPISLDAATQYGFDVRMTASTSAWQTGIPTVYRGNNNYSGGQSYTCSQWTDGDKGNWTATDLALAIPTANNDWVFHLDMTPIPTQVWDDTTNNWDTSHWIPEGGGPLGMPVTNLGMIVNGGTANVLSDLSATYPAQSLLIARDASSGTVNVGNGTAGHLRVTSFVEVNPGGTLNVNNGTLDAGATLNVLGGSATVGAAGVLNATKEVNVNAAGGLTVAGALNTPTLNTQGGTSIGGGTIGTLNTSGVTSIGGGAIGTINTSGATSIAGGAIGTLNATAGTVGISTPASAITTLNGKGATINSSGALATNVNLTSGTINVSANTAVGKLNVAGGQILAGPNSVIIGTELKLGTSTTFTGTGFGAGGTITKDGVGRLELNGGTVGIAVSGAPENLNQYTYRVVTGADSGISSANVYSHAIDIGNTTTATVLPAYINGVTFQRYFDASQMPGSQQAPNGHNGGNTDRYQTNIPQATYPNLWALYNDFRYNAATNNIVLTGLTPGEYYEMRLYMRTWGATTDNRRQQFDAYIGDSPTSQTTWIVNEDNPLDSANTAAWNALVAANGGFTAGTAWAMGYVFQADDAGKFTLRATAQSGAGTLHVYGLTNQALVAGDGMINMPGTDIVANAPTTLSLDTPDPVTFGNLIFADLAATVTIGAGPSQIAFGELLFDPNLAIMEGEFTLLKWDADTTLVDFTAPPDMTLFETAGYTWELNDYLAQNELRLTLTDAAIPEPATMALLGLAAAGLGGYVRRRKV